MLTKLYTRVNRFTSFVKTYPVTAGIIILNAVFFIVSIIMGASPWLPEPQELIAVGANFNPLTFDHQAYRLITAAFLHAGIIHLSVNMFSLYSIGRAIEAREGRVKYLVIYLVSALSSTLSSSWFSVFRISVGASGAIFGLLGYFFVLNLIYLIADTRGNWKVFRNFLFILALNLGLGFAVSFIDNAAHLGGFFAGIVVTVIYLLVEKYRVPVLRRNALVIFVAAFSLYGVYCIIPREQVWFYKSLSLYLHNEKEANKLLNEVGYTKEQLIGRLSAVESIWQVNGDLMKNNFQDLPSELSTDISTLSRYARDNRKLAMFRRKSLTGEANMKDSAEIYINKTAEVQLMSGLEPFFTAAPGSRQ